jgi:hypothetical protein
MVGNLDVSTDNGLHNKREILEVNCGIFAGFFNGFLIIPRWSLQATGHHTQQGIKNEQKWVYIIS